MMSRWWGKRRSAALGAALLFSLTGLSLLAGGCKGTESQMSKDEEENFKGGPMPAGFLEQQQGGANRAPGAPPGAPAVPAAPAAKTPAK